MSIPSISSAAEPDDQPPRERIKSHGAASLDRLPPNSEEAERGVIGCCLLSPQECISETVTALTDPKSEEFYDLRHRLIFQSMVGLMNKSIPVDLISIVERLKIDGTLEQIGGIPYLSQLQDAVPSAANLAYYLAIIREKYLLRRAIQICNGVVANIYEFEGEADALLDQVEREVLSIRQFRVGITQRKMVDLVGEAMNQIEFMVNNPGTISGLPTGFEDLDLEIDGMQPSDLIVVAAYPSVGKTSFAMNIVEHVALDLGCPVGVFSAEMGGASLVRRMLCSQAGVNLRAIRRGFDDENIPKLNSVASKLAGAPIHIDDTSDMTITMVRAKARRMVQQHGIKLFVADYAQLFKSPGAENRTNELEQVSSGFKNLAKELGVPVILLSQLNDDGKLKGARSIGADADAILLLKKLEADKVELKIDKARNSMNSVRIILKFVGAYTRFESMPKFAGEDVPARQPLSDP